MYDVLRATFKILEKNFEFWEDKVLISGIPWQRALPGYLNPLIQASYVNKLWGYTI